MPEIASLLVYDGALIAGGWFDAAGGVPARHLARWDGTSWSEYAGGLDDSGMALAEYNGDLVAAGWFDEAGGVPVTNIARWDGSTWHPLGSGVDHGVLDLCIFGSDLAVSGVFWSAGGLPTRNVARWNGEAWSTFGSGAWGHFSDSVKSLLPVGEALYAAGSFVYAGGIPSYFIARWDEPVPTAVTIADLAAVRAARGARLSWRVLDVRGVAGFHVYRDDSVSGRLRLTESPVAAREQCEFLDPATPDTGAEYWIQAILRDGSAEWFGPVRLAALGAPRAVALEAGPSPFGGRTSIRYELPVDGSVELSVVDVFGRRVLALVRGLRPAGRNTVEWDGRDSDGKAVGSGVYFVLLEAVGEVRTSKVILAR